MKTHKKAKSYYDKDANLSLLKNKKIVFCMRLMQCLAGALTGIACKNFSFAYSKKATSLSNSTHWHSQWNSGKGIN